MYIFLRDGKMLSKCWSRERVLTKAQMRLATREKLIKKNAQKHVSDPQLKSKSCQNVVNMSSKCTQKSPTSHQTVVKKSSESLQKVVKKSSKKSSKSRQTKIKKVVKK